MTFCRAEVGISPGHDTGAPACLWLPRNWFSLLNAVCFPQPPKLLWNRLKENPGSNLPLLFLRCATALLTKLNKTPPSKRWKRQFTSFVRSNMFLIPRTKTSVRYFFKKMHHSVLSSSLDQILYIRCILPIHGERRLSAVKRCGALCCPKLTMSWLMQYDECLFIYKHLKHWLGPL